jgi:N-acetylglucosamine kinase-like BadF-type ATPase
VADVEYAVLGLAGVDTDAQHGLISVMLKNIGFERFGLYNDAFLGVAAGCPGGVGICAINGTGSKLAAVDYSGVDVQTCGLGDLTDDFGGGGWYGTKAISAVYAELYKLGRPTVMRDMMFLQIGISRKEDYLEVLTHRFAEESLDSVAINSIVFEAAAQGDAVALDILEQSAEHYAGGIAYLAKDMDFPTSRTLFITLAGSVFIKQKVKILQGFIDRRVRTALGDRPIDFVNLDAPPVAGAILWAAQKSGFDIDMPAIRTAIEGFLS